MSTKSRVSKEKQQQINQALVAGSSIKDVSAKSGETYSVVASFRKKLANAGIVPHLYKPKTERIEPIAKAKKVDSPETGGMKVTINGVLFDIYDATSVKVSKDGVEVITK